MPTPAKPYAVLVAEKKSHRTKKELKARKEAEDSLLTGVKLKERPEVKDNPIAHKEFLRINKLLKNIEKNDAIYEAIINRYCMMQAEVVELEDVKIKLQEKITNMEYEFENIEGVSGEERAVLYIELVKTIDKLSRTLISYDKQIQSKRKMLLDIEKENIMTIAAALRNVPKTQEPKENPLLKALNANK